MNLHSKFNKKKFKEEKLTFRYTRIYLKNEIETKKRLLCLKKYYFLHVYRLFIALHLFNDLF